MRTILIGNPENRRVAAFQAELAAAGLPAAEVVSYRQLLEDIGALADLDPAEAIVRQDSAGEDFEVEKALLRRGYDSAAALGVSVIAPGEIDRLSFDRGRILCPRQSHLGFVSLLESLERLYAERPAWRVLQPPAGIRFLFDKRETSRRWRDDGIAVPEVLDGIASADQLRAGAAERNLREVFVKVSCSSSASCLAIYQRRREREQLTTTIECADTGWYNSLRLSRYRRRQQITEVLDYLIREGAQIEVAASKARLGGHPFDLRFVVVDGDPVFGLVRQNRHDITNLHLGGWRGQWSELEALVEPDVIEAARADAAAAATTSGCFVVGVDVLIEANRRRHRVIEGNAFGDLLPGLEHQGRSVYGWQINRLLTSPPR